jgi:hypothetical protein
MNRFRLAWLRRRKRTDPELPLKPPIQLGALSNGEIFRPDTPSSEQTRRLIFDKAEAAARRMGLDRREFLASSMGMATSLWALNVASGCSGNSGHSGGSGGAGGWPFGGAGSGGAGAGGVGGGREPMGEGGYFEVPKDPADPEAVCETMLDASKEFIFDVQTHHVNRANALYATFLQGQLRYSQYCGPQNVGAIDCFDRNEYVRLMFLESDTRGRRREQPGYQRRDRRESRYHQHAGRRHAAVDQSPHGVAEPNGHV